MGGPRSSQRSSECRDPQFSPPPNGGMPPQKTRRGEPPAPPLRAPTPELPGGLRLLECGGLGPRRCVRTVDAFSCSRDDTLANRVQGTTSGAFPEDKDAGEKFQLVTAPARVHAPGAPTHGDDGFWVREARENRWRRRKRKIDVKGRRERIGASVTGLRGKMDAKDKRGMREGKGMSERIGVRGSKVIDQFSSI
ncbi:hypothetical protein HO173_009033 [Letharia columbiana]|uniref:Uncharacterized protein n=1 Tax=Letharia columbiana TaxID=112416 RepID=A0A8H6FQH4_9LECA|nr:uncharacterized protein HO173_009033 [Letharia columbiana]KAF6232819.1 hypothetical protein HO173_009033 [Letharia columbiana]